MVGGVSVALSCEPGIRFGDKSVVFVGRRPTSEARGLPGRSGAQLLPWQRVAR